MRFEDTEEYAFEESVWIRTVTSLCLLGGGMIFCIVCAVKNHLDQNKKLKQKELLEPLINNEDVENSLSIDSKLMKSDYDLDQGYST